MKRGRGREQGGSRHHLKPAGGHHSGAVVANRQGPPLQLANYSGADKLAGGRITGEEDVKLGVLGEVPGGAAKAHARSYSPFC